MENKQFYPHVSVDCVILGFDGKCLKVLLLRRTGGEGDNLFNDLKLPGSLIFENEDIDEAANRVVSEIYPNKNFYIRQFKSFGSPLRTSNPRDIYWLEKASKLKIGRIVSIGYLSLLRIDNKMQMNKSELKAFWMPVNKIDKLAFDHHDIIKESIKEIKRLISHDSSLVYSLLPRKFTIANLKDIFEVLSGENIDIRNFYKKIKKLKYIVPLDDYEEKVSHRAARFYKFDKKLYKKTHLEFKN